MLAMLAGERSNCINNVRLHFGLFLAEIEFKYRKKRVDEGSHGSIWKEVEVDMPCSLLSIIYLFLIAVHLEYFVFLRAVLQSLCSEIYTGNMCLWYFLTRKFDAGQAKLTLWKYLLSL